MCVCGGGDVSMYIVEKRDTMSSNLSHRGESRDLQIGEKITWCCAS